VDNNGLRQSRNSFGTESGTVSDEIALERDPVADLDDALKRLGPAERERLRLRLGNLQDQRRERGPRAPPWAAAGHIVSSSPGEFLIFEGGNVPTARSALWPSEPHGWASERGFRRVGKTRRLGESR